MHLADSGVGILSESAIVGGGIPLAAGAALSARVRGTRQISLSFFGDGATNQGTFHETLNMASVWKLPVIFFCENNRYAITTSVETSHGQPDIAKRAGGYGIPGVIVDGQDLIAVHETTHIAVERARDGAGPTLIEAKTYRFDEHQVGLNIIGEPYRPQGEVQSYTRERDPLLLYKTVLLDRGFILDDLTELQAEVEAEVRQAVEFAERSPLPITIDVYRDMYVNPINYPPIRCGVTG